ncbi:MAG TPA: hypothetical protein VE175_00110, partial [Woeseiaceae bacterium]|nr:hypothetical protein [Woeseiaceae bacterium]
GVPRGKRDARFSAAPKTVCGTPLGHAREHSSVHVPVCGLKPVAVADALSRINPNKAKKYRAGELLPV